MVPSPPESDAGRFSLRPRHALLVFLLALLVRGAYLLEARGQPEFDILTMDSEYNVEWAKGLATGEWKPPYDRLAPEEREVFFRSPLYSYTLAGLFSVFGVNLLLARALQVILGSLSCVLAYGLGVKCFGRRVGLVTGILCALYWVLVFFDTEFLLPVALVFEGLFGFFFLFLGAERRSAWLAGLGALGFGLFAITRPNILAFFPFVLWWAFTVVRESERGRRLAFLGLVLAGMAVPPALVVWRNYAVSGELVPVASQGGVNFFIGNNPESNGWQAVVPGTRATWWGGFDDTRRIAAEDLGHEPSAKEVSEYWFGRGLAFARDEPGAWLRLTGRKALGMFGNVEIPNNEPYEVRRRRYLTLTCLPLTFVFLFGPFVASLPLQLRSSRDRLRRGFSTLLLVFLAVYSATIVVFFLSGRYRVPLLPYFALGAAVTLVATWDALRARAWPRAATLLGASALVALLFTPDYLDVRRQTEDWTDVTEAQDHLRRGEVELALERLQRARARDTRKFLEFYKNFAAVCRRAGEIDLGIEVTLEGVEGYPNERTLLQFLAGAYVQKGEWREALAWSQRYLDATRRDEISGLFYAYVALRELGREDEARGFLERARAAAPQHELTRQMEALERDG